MNTRIRACSLAIHTNTQKRASIRTHIYQTQSHWGWISFLIASSVTFKFKYIGTFATEFFFPNYRLGLARESVPIPIYTQSNCRVFLSDCIISVWNKHIIVTENIKNYEEPKRWELSSVRAGHDGRDVDDDPQPGPVVAAGGPLRQLGVGLGARHPAPAARAREHVRRGAAAARRAQARQPRPRARLGLPVTLHINK